MGDSKRKIPFQILFVGGAIRFRGLLVDEALGGEGGVALVGALGVGQLRGILGQLALGHVQLRLQVARVDHGQQIAGLEQAGQQLSEQLGAAVRGVTTEPLQRWCEDDRVIAWAEKHHGRPWARLRAFERADALIHWVHDSKAVLLLDDAHKLTGRKLDVVLQLCRECSRLVIGTWSEQSLPMSLRMLLDRRDPQRIHLHSEAAYDVTNLVIWLLMIAALGIGWWQLAAVLAGMKVLAGGRRAARQH